ncbi:MAG: hypothetical protein PHH60_03235 [Candidatus Margulisbacteria bacterium]|nr:hypothetical protein [Candidatus Margulisiibacteriota bacterium]
MTDKPSGIGNIYRGGGRNGWTFDRLSREQRMAAEWLGRKDPRLLRELLYRTAQLTRTYHGCYLIEHILTAVQALKNTPGLLRLLSNATGQYRIGDHRRIAREGNEIMGAAHEILRLGHLTSADDPVDVINYVEEHEGVSTEMDGILRSGVALEMKMATSGLAALTEKQQDQAKRYAQLLKAGKIAGVAYHITAPDIGLEAVKFLLETIPGVKIYRYQSLITETGRVDDSAMEIRYLPVSSLKTVVK